MVAPHDRPTDEVDLRLLDEALATCATIDADSTAASLTASIERLRRLAENLRPFLPDLERLGRDWLNHNSEARATAAVACSFVALFLLLDRHAKILAGWRPPTVPEEQ